MSAQPRELASDIRALLLSRLFHESAPDNYEHRIAIPGMHIGTNRLYRIVYADGCLTVFDGDNDATLEIACEGGPRAAVSRAIDLITCSSRFDPPWRHAITR